MILVDGGGAGQPPAAGTAAQPGPACYGVEDWIYYRCDPRLAKWVLAALAPEFCPGTLLLSVSRCRQPGCELHQRPRRCNALNPSICAVRLARAWTHHRLVSETKLAIAELLGRMVNKQPVGKEGIRLVDSVAVSTVKKKHN